MTSSASCRYTVAPTPRQQEERNLPRGIGTAPLRHERSCRFKSQLRLEDPMPGSNGIQIGYETFSSQPPNIASFLFGG